MVFVTIAAIVMIIIVTAAATAAGGCGRGGDIGGYTFTVYIWRWKKL